MPCNRTQYTRFVVRITLPCLLLMLAGCSGPPAPAPVRTSATPDIVVKDRAKRIIAEVNALRANPAAYAAHIEERLPYYRGNELRIPGRVAIRTSEGAQAAAEAIAALHETSPVPPVEADPSLMRSAEDHARDIGPKGMLSHEGSSGESLSDRVRRYAASFDRIGENISFGPDQPRDVVVDLVIDDNVPDRGHRRILLDPRFRKIGVSCGPHAVYRTVCVLDFAGNLVAKRGAQ